MAVDDGDRGVVVDADVVWRDAHHSAILLVRFMNNLVAFAASRRGQKPQVRQPGCQRPRDRAQSSVSDDVRIQEEKRQASQPRPRREEKGDGAHGLR